MEIKNPIAFIFKGIFLILIGVLLNSLFVYIAYNTIFVNIVSYEFNVNIPKVSYIFTLIIYFMWGLVKIGSKKPEYTDIEELAVATKNQILAKYVGLGVVYLLFMIVY